MARPRFRLSRRALLASGLSFGFAERLAFAFGQEGAFHARVLTTGGKHWDGPRALSLGRWAWELVRRTSAPARLVPGQIAADDPRLLAEPFAVWPGDTDVPALSAPEVSLLRRFLELGGVLLVDDSDPEGGAFGRAARREMARVVPESPLVRLRGRASSGGAPEHVVFKSYYLVDKPAGRVAGPPFLEAIVRGRDAQVIFLATDLLGALARTPEGSWQFSLDSQDRELSIRFAVNLAMYVLCSNYKDDQVHAQALMRRRGRAQP